MDYNTIAIIVSVVAVGIGLAALIVPSLRDLRRDVDGLRERIARLEGLFGGVARRGSPGPEATP